MNDSLQTYYETNSIQLKEQLFETQNQIQQNITQQLQHYIQNNVTEQIRQKIEEKNQQINQKLDQIPKEINLQDILNFNNQIPQNISKYFPQNKQLIVEGFFKLQESIDLIQDPLKILFLTTTISEQNLKQLNPKFVRQFNTKNITPDQFKDEMNGINNCLILAKVKENEGSQFEYYGGYAPETKIFMKKYSGFLHTSYRKGYNSPYTLDLNIFSKRNLEDKDWQAYYNSPESYFSFINGGFSVFQNNSFNFAKNDNSSYYSPYPNENVIQKKYNSKKMHSIEIEIITLF